MADEPNGPSAAGMAMANEHASTVVNHPVVAAQSSDSSLFVGRQKELALLRTAVDAGAAGRGRVLLLLGEPGIGKTRTAQELATHAQQRGMRVLWGRCSENAGAPAYWPWVQIIRGHLQERTTEELLADLGEGAANIALVISAVRERLPELPQPPPLQPEQARFRFFDSFSIFLKNAARRQPLMLVLDDLHWADAASLLLLQFVARDLDRTPLVIVGTYRDHEARHGQPLSETIAEISRSSLGHSVRLAGLGEVEVERFIEAIAGYRAAKSLVAALTRDTEGNPFFVAELVRLLLAEGRLELTKAPGSFAVPPGVRDVISRRMERLGAQCQQVLGIAAVIGRDFELGVLEKVSGLEREQLLNILDEAIAARTVVPGDAGRYAFAHGLMRETLYGELAAAHRAELHHRIAAALETLSGAKRDAHLSELAHHYFEALAFGNADKAVEYNRRAGERVATQLAYEDAIVYYQRALHVLDIKATADEALRYELVFALAENVHRSGDRTAARAHFARALELARTLQRPDLFANAALGLGKPYITRLAFHVGTFDEALAAVLEEALHGLGTADSVLRARVLSCLANAIMYSPFVERRDQLRRQALEMARRLNDPATLAIALHAQFDFEPEERLRRLTEVLQLAEAAGDKEMMADTYASRRISFLTLGRVAEMRADVEAFESLANKLRLPQHQFYLVQWRTLEALLRGRFDAAESLMHQALTLGQQIQNPAVMQSFGTQLFSLRKEQGRLAELELGMKAFADQYPALPGWRAGLAVLYVETNRETEARAEFERLAESGFTSIARNGYWLVTMALLADACTGVGDVARSRQLYDLLRPFAQRYILLDSSGFYGPVARVLGGLATTLEHWDDADAHFTAAIAASRLIDSAPWRAHAEYQQASMLLKRGRPVDQARAVSLLDNATATARQLSMKALLDRALAARRIAEGRPQSTPLRADQRQGPARAIDEPSNLAPSSGAATLRHEGEYWTICHAGITAQLKDMKGLRYLLQLLLQPGREMHVLDLVRGHEDSVVDLGLDSAPVLDARAKAAYRRRLNELRGELQHAQDSHDSARVQALSDEIEALTRQLAGAVGLGGRDRNLTSAADRARSTVTQRLKAAIKKIGEGHPDLAAYLTDSIKTGTFCVYNPHPARPMSWQF